MDEVWITGLGAVTAVGRDPEAIRAALLGGASGVRPRPELGGAPAAVAERGPVDPRDRRAEPGAALFRQAAERAWRGAELADGDLEPERIGVSDGSSVGPLAEALRRAAARREGARVRPSAVVQLMPGAGGAAFAQAIGAEGPVLHVSAGSVAAVAAIGEAALWVAAGRVDAAVAGGAESPLQADLLEHFRAAGILCEAVDAGAPCRPFDPERRGTVLGEGAGAVVLERADRARRRGATPLAVLRGYGLTSERGGRAAPEAGGAGVHRAARRALEGAPGPPAWVKAHGSGTPLGDAAELAGLHALLGADLADTVVTGIKPAVGHCLGASGAVETVLVALALAEGIVPATLGTRALDPALPRCRLALDTRPAPPGDVLLLAEGFGGRCAALRLGRP